MQLKGTGLDSLPLQIFDLIIEKKDGSYSGSLGVSDKVSKS